MTRGAWEKQGRRSLSPTRKVLLLSTPKPHEKHSVGFHLRSRLLHFGEQEAHGLDGRMCQTAPSHGSVLQHFAIGVYKPTFLSLTLAFCLASPVTTYRRCGRFYSTLYNDCYLSLASEQRKSLFAPYTAVLIEEGLKKKMALATPSRETKRKTEIQQKKMNL